MPRSRLYAGDTLRALRRAAGLNQRAMAVKLGLSVSYLSQLESGERPLTAAVSAALARHFPSALAGIEGEVPARRHSALAAALADPAVAPLDAESIARLAEERPDLADRFVALHAAKRAAEERAALAEEAMITSAGLTGTGARLPWEAVRDWFHDAGNYVDVLDRAAEALASGGALDQRLADHGVAVALDPDDAAPLARFDGRMLTLAAATPPETRRFLVAHRLAALAFAMAFIYAQVTVNDFVIARYTADAWRARVYAVRYFITYLISGAAISMIAFLHSRGGFDLVLSVTAVIAMGFVFGTAAVALLVNGVERDAKAMQPAE